MRSSGADSALLWRSPPACPRSARACRKRRCPNRRRCYSRICSSRCRRRGFLPTAKRLPDATPGTPRLTRSWRDFHAAAARIRRCARSLRRGALRAPRAGHRGASAAGAGAHRRAHRPTLGAADAPTAGAPRYCSLLPLPKPYVVPGGRFREIYYWDSYFTMLGLIESGRRTWWRTWCAISRYLIDTYGHVPNGASNLLPEPLAAAIFFRDGRPDFAHRSCGGVRPLSARSSSANTPSGCKGKAGLRAGSAHRRVVAIPDGSILNRYWDDRDTPRDESYAEDMTLARRAAGRPAPLFRDIRAAAESGWDFGSRWFADPDDRASIDTTDIVPVDLNSLLYGLENAIRAGCERAADAACVREFTRRAAAPPSRHRPLSLECRAPRATSITAGRFARPSPGCPRRRCIRLFVSSPRTSRHRRYRQTPSGGSC